MAALGHGTIIIYPANLKGFCPAAGGFPPPEAPILHQSLSSRYGLDEEADVGTKSEAEYSQETPSPACSDRPAFIDSLASAFTEMGSILATFLVMIWAFTVAFYVAFSFDQAVFKVS